MNKWSNNVIARHVLATLGATAEPGDSVAAGGRVVEQSLRAGGVDTSGFVIENGAGLSRSARISARPRAAALVAQPDDARAAPPCRSPASTAPPGGASPTALPPAMPTSRPAPSTACAAWPATCWPVTASATRSC
jgi:hypothetical protein